MTAAKPQLDQPLPPNPEAETAIAAIEAGCEVLRSPCGAGSMVWRVWGLGSGRPNIVLFHGGYGSWLHWIRNIPFLAERFTVYAADLPGLGDSSPPPDRRDPDAMGGVVAEGLRHVIPPGEPFSIVGFSFGSIMGGHAAQFLGPELRRYVLVGAGGLGLTRADGPPLEKFRREMSPEELRRLARRNLEILMFADPANIDEVAIHMQMTNTTRAVTKSRWISRAATLARILPAVAAKVPIAGIWGGLDSTAHPHLDQRERLLRGLRSDADFRVIPGAGHWVMYEAADAFNATLVDVLEHP
jgi:2-hydroxy-6-oxonona-2,4-dienedioate hydrolase